jgi:hypothetical protein
MGEWRCRSTILDLSNRWRRVVSFTLLPIYSQGPSLRYPLDRMLCMSQSRPRRYGEEQNHLLLPGIEAHSSAVHPVTQSLYRLSYPGSGIDIVTCQPFVGLRNGALLGSRPVKKSSAQPRWRHTSGVRECHVCLCGCQETSRHLVRLQREWGTWRNSTVERPVRPLLGCR